MLENTLKTLWQRLNSERIIRDCLTWSCRSLSEMATGEDFVFLYRHDHPALTLDQIRGVEALLRTNWMKEKNSPCYKYSKRDSLFNVVLRYTEERLFLKDDHPVCKYTSVIGWHELSMQLGEDLFTTALTAAHDAKQHRVRTKFDWHPYVRTEHPALEDLYNRPLTELHAHLKGTSLNFDLNWLSLMNSIQKRAKEFEMFGKRQHAQITVQMEDHVNDLYHQIMKAAAIRLYLFAEIQAHAQDVKDIVFTLLRTQTRLEATFDSMTLQENIDSYRQTYGRRYYRRDEGYDIPDYAIVTNSSYKDGDSLYSVLSGERRLIYWLLRRCYEGKLSHQQEGLLTAYLVIKTRLRMEMVQLNEGVGFDNFATYEGRKTAFIKDGTIYERLVAQLAIGNFLKAAPDKRYMEARIVPKETADGVRQQINETDADVHNPQFDKGEGWQYHYIYHFIKADDKTKEHLQELVPRHHALREKVKRQAKAIYNYRNFNLLEESDRVVGIDAANSEILARPEVFAQAFRYLRRHSISGIVVNRPNDLGITYHVGEDFMDVADGLRAYDEVIRYLQFGEGDRLGHALVLGVDVVTYYQNRNYVVALPLQMVLDNVAWLYHESKDLGDTFVLVPQLEREYEYYFRKLTDNRLPICSINTYYHSWLLRGDNPFCYQIPGANPVQTVSVDEWDRNNLVTGDREIDKARDDAEARKLYSYYHFNRKMKEKGKTVIEYPITEAYVKTLELVRERKLCDAEARHLAIECNPTSNYKIGEVTDFAEHPIIRFYNEGIGKYVDKKHYISASINTDDAGVFSTSIEREYAVMAKALEEKYRKKEQLSPKQIYDWLDDVRMFGQQQRFVKR